LLPFLHEGNINMSPEGCLRQWHNVASRYLKVVTCWKDDG
jgi:hypothetical protein